MFTIIKCRRTEPGGNKCLNSSYGPWMLGTGRPG